ncbi:MAG: Flp pilus assembly complex ATPase component TadA, partial [Bdellovibrionales bacterium]|nr:Flp pilus assembly complex ATPase component TadA [Bdellovibrionales bacterium]
MNSRAINTINKADHAPEIVENILKIALQLNASDIHIGGNNVANSQNPYLLRYRVNGRLQEVDSKFLTATFTEVIARIKILSKMDITAHAIPQDGKFNIQANGENINFRVNVAPGINNIEEVCMRINRSKTKEIALQDMLMTEAMREQVDQLIHQKSGIFIINGPAGQGKTTTIYAILKELAGPNTKIVTAEDPVEKELPYITHNQITNKVTFADLGRSFMRQDAEVIFIGEIRDEDSAFSAQQLAQTGHLVLTTIHTRDSIGVIGRLEAFSIDPNSIASTLIGSLAQRLVPALCQKCKVVDALPQDVLDKINPILPIPEGVELFKKGPGCQHCNQYLNQQVVSSGIKGSLPIFELFVVDDEIAEMINQRKSKVDIAHLARSKGMLSLSQ